MDSNSNEPNVFDRQSWGLPKEAVSDLAGRWVRPRACRAA